MLWVKKHRFLIRNTIFILLAAMLTGAIVWLSLQFPSTFSAPTSAFCFLIIVLLTAFFGDLMTGVVISILAAISFNYFYLPPVGQFTIASFPDIVSFIAFLLTSLFISRLTASAAENSLKAKNYDAALVQLKELSDCLLSTPENELTLSKIAQETLRIFSLDYCSIRGYGENKWHHFSGTAMRDISTDIEKGSLKLDHDHPTDIMQFADESILGVQFIQVYRGAQPHALLAIKSSRLPENIIKNIAGVIGIRLLSVA
jgi:K+-sensing histidine kinase KdpD